MKSLIVIACVFGAVAVASFVYWAKPLAQDSSASLPAEEEVYLLEPEQQMGVVGLNEQISGTFTVVNNTERTVTFDEPMKSCSCASAGLERRELGPGERCALTFAIQTGSRRAPRIETVGLNYTTSDGSRCGQLYARVKFVPKGVFEVEPAGVILTRTKPKASFVVRVDPKAERNKVIEVRSNHRCVKVDASALPTVTIELNLDTPDESILNTECLVYTNNSAEDTIRVPVQVRKE